jgi:hypothetical protein
MRADARRLWIESGGLEETLPALTERAMNVMRETGERPFVLSQADGGQSIVLRQVFKNWLRDCAAGPCSAFIGDEG